jgi:UDPglucose 6-dehydrogenase
MTTYASPTIGVVGLGFVGQAMLQSFTLKGVDVIVYDKYKNGGMGSLGDCLKCAWILVAVPTVFDSVLGHYDTSSLEETCAFLSEHQYTGGIIIKCTVEPGTTSRLGQKYSHLQLIHNPEFLTARTAFEDFHNQKHIVLGLTPNVSEDLKSRVTQWYQTCYPLAQMSICTSLESESMKIFCNCFYAVKVQFFTELYMLCQKNGANFNVIRDLMLKNGWINPMHTIIPGPDGQISYGGYCFPKDTRALDRYMTEMSVPHELLGHTIKERDTMRTDHDNCK